MKKRNNIKKMFKAGVVLTVMLALLMPSSFVVANFVHETEINSEIRDIKLSILIDNVPEEMDFIEDNLPFVVGADGAVTGGLDEFVSFSASSSGTIKKIGTDYSTDFSITIGNREFFGEEVNAKCRGYAEFDISTIPNDVKIVEAYLTTSVVDSNNDPVRLFVKQVDMRPWGCNPMDYDELWTDLGGGSNYLGSPGYVDLEYCECLGSIDLFTQAALTKLENSLVDTCDWFAVGFYTNSEGTADKWIEMSSPTLYVTYDEEDPETDISSGPSGHINYGNVHFSWYGIDDLTEDDDLVFKYILQGHSSWSTNWEDIRGIDYWSLPDGSYTFKVKARDEAGRIDQTPAARSFIVDTQPPNTIIDDGPSGTIGDNDVTFTWHGSDTVTLPENLQYYYMLEDHESSWSSLTSDTSKTYNDLPDGSYTFKVKARDEAGNVDPSPAERSFTVETDTEPPDTEIISGPSGFIGYNDVTFTWTGSDDRTLPENLLYDYRLVGYDSSWSSLTSATSKTYNGLPDGDYTFQVRARDEAGKVDPSPAERSFTVDTQPPETPVIESSTHPSETTWYSNNIVDFQWNPVGGPSSVTYRYKFDYETDWHTTTSTSVSCEDVLDGTHTFELNASDTGGTSPIATCTVKIDVTAPYSPNILSNTHHFESTWYSNNNPSFYWWDSFDRNHPDSSGLQGYSYGLHPFPFHIPNNEIDATEPFPITVSYFDVADGITNFHVKAIDNVGNTGSISVDHYEIKIDTLAPITSNNMLELYDMDLPVGIDLSPEEDYSATPDCSGVDYTMIQLSKWDYCSSGGSGEYLRLEMSIQEDWDYEIWPNPNPPKPPRPYCWQVIIPWEGYNDQIIEESGRYRLEFYSVDYAGNVEEPNIIHFTVGPNDDDD